MIFQVRQGVFETNSSSTHTLTICSKDDFDKWGRGEVFWLDNGSLEAYTTDDFYVRNGDLEAYTTDDFYVRNGDLETYSETFTSPSGDEMVAFGAFGYDG